MSLGRYSLHVLAAHWKQRSHLPEQGGGAFASSSVRTERLQCRLRRGPVATHREECHQAYRGLEVGAVELRALDDVERGQVGTVEDLAVTDAHCADANGTDERRRVANRSTGWPTRSPTCLES
jgi:hypothetical protein